MMKMKRILVWFRHDLRLTDNITLHNALADAEEIIPFYCFDDHYFQELPFGFPKTGAFRAQFICESVNDLKQNLQEKGADLVVTKGDTASNIKKLHQHFKLDAIYLSEEVSQEELDMESQVEALGIPLKRFWNYSLYCKTDLPFKISETPEVFTNFRKKLEKYSKVREELITPKSIQTPNLEKTEVPVLKELGLEAPALDSRVVLTFRGGETAAWERLQHYFWNTEKLKEYKETRNGMLGADYSSKFSPWLAQGCISPVSIYGQVRKFEKGVKKNSSTYWLIFELIWRDFFRFTALKEGQRFFKMKRNWKPPVSDKFYQWKEGACGQDFVDANMKELALTGFMSNRGRQNVASYLTKDLHQPWYAGAAWFESQLIDYDVCSNYGNWTYLAGVGNDPREGRYFKVAKQAERYDANASYRLQWLKKE